MVIRNDRPRTRSWPGRKVVRMHANSHDDLVANVAAILFGLCTLVTSGVILASTL